MHKHCRKTGILHYKTSINCKSVTVVVERGGGGIQGDYDFLKLEYIWKYLQIVQQAKNDEKTVVVITTRL